MGGRADPGHRSLPSDELTAVSDMYAPRTRWRSYEVEQRAS